jgi:non-heme chloroperoxidase
MTNDWRDVIKTKIDVRAAVFVGELSDFVDGARWIASVIDDSRLFVYTEEEQGDHFLAFKNPVKSTADLHDFLST